MASHISVTINTESTKKSASLKSLLASLLAPRCPGCKGKMFFYFQMPDDYREVSPKYYQCESCQQCYCRTFSGPWVKTAKSDMPSREIVS